MRDRYLQVLLTGQVLRSDAIVVLCGEDAIKRAECALELFAQRAAYGFLISGGRHEPPRHIGWKPVEEKLIAGGVALDRIKIDKDSQNTKQQAENVIQLAIEKGWKRLILVASPYHIPRAHLTFVRELQKRQQDENIHVLVVPASQTKWWECPEGAPLTRLDLGEGEADRIQNYVADVATYEEGLTYLQFWESKT